jgi:hypothetical protein
LFIPHAPKEGKQGGGQEGAEGRVGAGVVAVRAVQPLRAGTGGVADDDKDDCDEEEEEDGVKNLTAVELAGALISMLTSGGEGSLLECVQGQELGRAGRKPGCFSHEPGATRAGPGARFSSTREAPGRAGCMFQQNPARSRVHPPG